MCIDFFLCNDFMLCFINVLKLNDLVVKVCEFFLLFLFIYDNFMRFRNLNYNKDYSMMMKSKFD